MLSNTHTKHHPTCIERVIIKEQINDRMNEQSIIQYVCVCVLTQFP